MTYLTLTVTAVVAFALAGVAAFKYHDNGVKIDSDVAALGFSFNGSYGITDFQVTSGQDPEDHIANGQVRQFSGGGSMVFSVGRKASNDVAHWWSDRIAPGQNTFGHSPDELNFAFLGTMSLTLSGGILPGPTRFTIQNVGLAQGHSGGNNNWWFGGDTCVLASGETVRCAATRDGTSETWKFTFLRGTGSDVDVVVLTFAQAD
ncbi:hypothetical protein AURDEDRAFT_161797 [Auricularia subglabra TFB-10046 SS5]|nr:hypothetical protein AURDEDRAFT_161797 [Auricularia subglabra TFB-10046 SS5]